VTFVKLAFKVVMQNDWDVVDVILLHFCVYESTNNSNNYYYYYYV
jgi:hypothetical protein